MGPSGSSATIQGKPGWTHRIFRVQNGAHVVMTSLIISGGNVPALNGGGINVVSGSLSLGFVYITHNQAGYGGGIYNGGVLTAVDTALSANHAITDGGGLYNAAGGPGINADLVEISIFSN